MKKEGEAARGEHGCAARGDEGLRQLLLGAGAAVDLARTTGATPLFVACWKGRTDCVQLLSSYGASRQTHGLFIGKTAESFSRDYGHDALAEWLVLSCGWSPLHHLEVLSVERTRALLRAGADVHLRPSAGDTSSPLERAQQLAPGSAAACLVVRAAGPWSVESHDLFPDADRARAFLRVQDRNLMGTGCEGEVEASCTRRCINQPVSRVRRVDGVEVDATIQLECAVKF